MRHPRSTLFPYTTLFRSTTAVYNRRMDTAIHRERWRLLHQVVRLLEVPMMILGLVWVVLLSIDLVRGLQGRLAVVRDRKSTRLNSSHPSISYAVFCLKNK